MSRIGLLLDEELSSKLIEVAEIYDRHPYDLLCQAIETLWKGNQRKPNNA